MISLALFAALIAHPTAVVTASMSGAEAMAAPLFILPLTETSLSFAQSMFLPNELYQVASNLSSAESFDLKHASRTIGRTIFYQDAENDETKRPVPTSESHIDDLSPSAHYEELLLIYDGAAGIQCSSVYNKCSSRSRIPSNPETYSSSKRW
jgi:hypothetical protein